MRKTIDSLLMLASRVSGFGPLTLSCHQSGMLSWESICTPGVRGDGSWESEGVKVATVEMKGWYATVSVQGIVMYFDPR